MRAIGIDYGLKRTGVAIGDTETRMALPFEMFEGMANEKLAEEIGKLAKEERVGAVVVGLPLFADGGVSGQSKLTETFILLLEKACSGVPVIRVSEYLTSHGAEGKLAGHFTRMQKRARVDALAAAAILQDWLDGQPKG